MGEYNGQRVGTWGDATAFSMHPLKIINVWGDAGIVVTNDDEMNRRSCGCCAITACAIATRWKSSATTRASIPRRPWSANGSCAQLPTSSPAASTAPPTTTRALRGIPQVRMPPRRGYTKNVYLLYILFAQDRDALLAHCLERGIEAKVHYPIPLHLQDALRHSGYKPATSPSPSVTAGRPSAFPSTSISSRAEQDYVIETVREFYAGKR